MKLFKYEELKSNINGLKFIPNLLEYDNNNDWIENVYMSNIVTNINEKHQKITKEFSEKNKLVLKALIDDLKAKNMFNVILEIGVNRSGEHSSTQFILNNKTKDTKYIGIDMQPGLIASIYSEQQNNYGLATDSSNYDQILKYINSLGVSKIDLFIIDGWHSVNQVVKDWKFTDILNLNGHVLMHDTNYHPGPYCVYEAIDENYYKKEKHLFSELYDWGVATATKIKNY